MLLGLRVGDPHDELPGAWLAKESVRDTYLTDDRADAELLIDKAIAGCADDDVSEIRSLGKTLRSWRTEILAHHDAGASNGPIEGTRFLRRGPCRRVGLRSLGSSWARHASCPTTQVVVRASMSSPQPPQFRRNGFCAPQRCTSPSGGPA